MIESITCTEKLHVCFWVIKQLSWQVISSVLFLYSVWIHLLKFSFRVNYGYLVKISSSVKLLTMYCKFPLHSKNKVDYFHIRIAFQCSYRFLVAMLDVPHSWHQTFINNCIGKIYVSCVFYVFQVVFFLFSNPSLPYF